MYEKIYTYKDGEIRTRLEYDESPEEKALHVAQTSEPAPGTCAFKFYKRRTTDIAKFKRGLELLGD